MVGAFLNERLIIAARATRRSVVLLGLAIASFVGPTIAAAGELNIYSHRQQFLLQPFLDAFTAETGIRTKVVYASKGLAQRLLAEGEASPADVILTVDIARLNEYAELDLLAEVDSPVLKAKHPGQPAGSRRPLVRLFDTGPACRDLEGACRRRCHRQYRGPGQPEMGGQGVQSQGKSRLQSVPDGFYYRRQWPRCSGRMGARPGGELRTSSTGK